MSSERLRSVVHAALIAALSGAAVTTVVAAAEGVAHAASPPLSTGARHFVLREGGTLVVRYYDTQVLDTLVVDARGLASHAEAGKTYVLVNGSSVIVKERTLVTFVGNVSATESFQEHGTPWVEWIQAKQNVIYERDLVISNGALKTSQGRALTFVDEGAYIRVYEGGKPLADGTYPLSADGAKFNVDGGVVTAGLADFLYQADLQSR